MIEKVLLDYLNDKLSVPVLMERPSRDTGKYVLIEKTGSAGNRWLKESSFAIQSYGKSLYDCAVLNNDVYEAMLSIAEEVDDVTKVSLNSDYNYTDTTTKEYRYQAIYDIVHY